MKTNGMSRRVSQFVLPLSLGLILGRDALEAVEAAFFRLPLDVAVFFLLLVFLAAGSGELGRSAVEETSLEE